MSSSASTKRPSSSLETSGNATQAKVAAIAPKSSSSSGLGHEILAKINSPQQGYLTLLPMPKISPAAEDNIGADLLETTYARYCNILREINHYAIVGNKYGTTPGKGPDMEKEYTRLRILEIEVFSHFIATATKYFSVRNDISHLHKIVRPEEFEHVKGKAIRDAAKAQTSSTLNKQASSDTAVVSASDYFHAHKAEIVTCGFGANNKPSTMPYALLSDDLKVANTPFLDAALCRYATGDKYPFIISGLAGSFTIPKFVAQFPPSLVTYVHKFTGSEE